MWKAPGAHSPFAVVSFTVPVATTPSVCSSVFRWKQILMPFNPCPCHYLSLTAHPSSTNSQKHSQSLLVLTSCPFSFSMQGHQHEKEPWSSHPAPSIVCPLRLWCTDKQEREARPSTCLPPCSPPFQQPQPAFTAV